MTTLNPSFASEKLCDDEWEKIGKICIRDFNVLLNFEESVAFCKSQNSEVYSPADRKNAILSREFHTERYYWIGYTIDDMNFPPSIIDGPEWVTDVSPTFVPGKFHYRIRWGVWSSLTRRMLKMQSTTAKSPADFSIRASANFWYIVHKNELATVICQK